MISCKHATELISKQMEERLSLREEVSLKIHLFVCEFCEKFRQQSEFIRKALSFKRKESEEEVSSISIPAKAKERLRERLGKS